MIDRTVYKKDFLTGCYTKEDLYDFLGKLCPDSRMHQLPFSLLIIDLDKFKHFNDKFGHLAGDDLLKFFSSALREVVYHFEGDIFRFGGDEFVIVFPGKTAKLVISLSDKISKRFKNRDFFVKGRSYKIIFSAGIAEFPLDADSPDVLLKRADDAMYFAKKHGYHHGQVVSYKQIGFKKAEEIFGMCVAVLSILLSVNFLFKLSGFTASQYVKSAFSKIIYHKSPEPAAVPVASKEKKALSKIYLKSGGVFQGEVRREDDQSVELELQSSSGVMVISIKKTDIEKVEKFEE